MPRAAKPSTANKNKPPAKTGDLSHALSLAEIEASRVMFPIQAPALMPGVVPAGRKAPVLAMDGEAGNIYEYAKIMYGGIVQGFPGYPYLAQLAARAEYRAFASAYSTEITREWLTLQSSDTKGTDTRVKITQLTQRLDAIDLKSVIQTCAEHDSLYGRGQFAIDIKGHNIALPLVLSPKTIKKGTFKGIRAVEAMWTTPSAYNAINPMASDFYRPTKWFMLGKEIHASRLPTVVTRPMPDMLKPAYNFGGISMSQLAEPYVNNWLRTRQSVADLLNNFSTTAMKTNMGQILQGQNAGKQLLDRAKLFTAHRSNLGMMLLDKETEDMVQLNVPLSGLDKLQAQAQEHMCSVSRMPAIILTGISPGGLNASSDSEIRVFYDWIAAQQEAFWRKAIQTVLNILQLDMYGVIDPNISFIFNPLYQMTPKELSEIRLNESTAATNYVNMGAVAPEEVREKIGRDPESGYQGLDLDSEVVNPNLESDDNDDEDEDDEESSGSGDDGGKPDDDGSDKH